MKRWLILAMLAASFTAFGQERAINDLMYLPDAKIFYTKASYDLTTDESEYKGASNGNIRVKDKTATFDLGYVVRENLSLEATFGYKSVLSLNEPNGAAEREVRSVGVTNPAFRFKWRALDQRSEDITVDIIPYFSVKTGKPKDPTASKDGNVTTGNGYGVEVNVGKKKENSQYMIFAKINHTMRYMSDDITYDPQTRYELGGIYQHSFAKSLFGNILLSRIHWDDYRNDNDTLNTFERFNARDSWSLGLEGIITPSKNLALSLGYKHFMPGDYSSKDENGQKTKFEDNKSSVVTMYVRYQF